jgi:hypothetical protein
MNLSAMKRILTSSALALSALALANCASEPPVVHHHYYRTDTRYVSTTKPSASVSHPKSAGVTSSSPEAFQAVTPPGSYSQ